MNSPEHGPNEILRLTARQDREELANAIYRLLGPYVSKVVLVFDPNAISIFAFPRSREMLMVGPPRTGEIRNWHEYDER